MSASGDEYFSGPLPPDFEHNDDNNDDDGGDDDKDAEPEESADKSRKHKRSDRDKKHKKKKDTKRSKSSENDTEGEPNSTKWLDSKEAGGDDSVGGRGLTDVEEPGRRYPLSKLEELQGEDNEGFDKGDERKLKSIQRESMSQASSSSTTVLAPPVLSPTVVS
jgi:hypothetical protein